MLDLDEFERYRQARADLLPQQDERAWAAYSLWFTRRGRLEEAHAAAEQMVRCAPESTLALTFLALSLMAQGRWDEALDASRKVTAMGPDDHTGWSLLGRALYHTGALGEAREALSRAVELKPQDPSAVVYLTRALAEAGDLHRAADVLERSTDLSTDDLQWWPDDLVEWARESVSGLRSGEVPARWWPA